MRNKIKTIYGSAKQKAAMAVALGVVTLATSPAHAAIDAAVGTAFTAVETDAKALAVMVTPFVVSVLGLVIVLKLIKKFGNKIG